MFPLVNHMEMDETTALIGENLEDDDVSLVSELVPKEEMSYIPSVGWMLLPGRIMRLKALFTSPYLWVVVGTPFAPLNLFCATAALLVSRLRNGKTTGKTRACLNVQITYLLMFFIPILLAYGISCFLHIKESDWAFVETLATGFLLGLISLVGILGLAFFNLRILAETAFGRDVSPIPRIHFIHEE